MAKWIDLARLPGMWLFAGCVSEKNGYPYDESFHSSYYVDLSFDNMFQSYVTLFMLMIQNNW